MATINSIDSNIPIEISKGGTNATSMTTNYGVILYDGSSIVTVASAGSATQILTSNGAGSAPTFQDGPSNLASAFYGYLASDTSLDKTGDGTVYQIVFDSERFDIGSDFNTTTGIYTTPSTGYYMIIAMPIYTVNAASTDTGSTGTRTLDRSAGIQSAKDHYRGRPEPMDSSTPADSGTGGDGLWGQSICRLFKSTAGDTFQIDANYGGSSLGKVTGFTAATNGARTIFTGYLVGT